MVRSSKQGSSRRGRKDIQSHQNFKEEPHLSGAYIRSLVKQLSSTRTKESMNGKPPENALGGDGFPDQSLTKFVQVITESQPTQQPRQPPQHKKQVRRRLHTSKPYQERMLNMAEARREIVTALKFHRAAMRRANERKQQEEDEAQRLQPPINFLEEQETKLKWSTPICPSNTSDCSNYIDNFALPLLPFTLPHPFSWNDAAQVVPSCPGIFNLTLPNQTLGLNLNYQNIINPPLPTPSSSSSSSSSSPNISFPASQEVLPIEANSGGLHMVMDDEGMAEIKSMGEQYQMEWNDAVNLFSSAWWFKFSKNMESEPEGKEDFGCHPFAELLEFPSWLNANGSCWEQQLQEYSSEDCLQDPALPCMDIGEIEGLDGEWLA